MDFNSAEENRNINKFKKIWYYMQEVIDYKNLETKILTGKETKIAFLSDDKIELRRGIEEEKHVIKIYMPWGQYDIWK